MHRGQRIYYTIEGSGPLVILQHGLLLNSESWKQSGIADALAAGYRVASIASLFCRRLAIISECCSPRGPKAAGIRAFLNAA